MVAPLDDYPRPSDAQIEAMLEDMARTYGYNDPCANCGEPLTDDGGIGWYCSECTATVQFHD